MSQVDQRRMMLRDCQRSLCIYTVKLFSFQNVPKTAEILRRSTFISLLRHDHMFHAEGARLQRGPTSVSETIQEAPARRAPKCTKQQQNEPLGLTALIQKTGDRRTDRKDSINQTKTKRSINGHSEPIIFRPVARLPSGGCVSER